MGINRSPRSASSRSDEARSMAAESVSSAITTPSGAEASSTDWAGHRRHGRRTDPPPTAQGATAAAAAGRRSHPANDFNNQRRWGPANGSGGRISPHPFPPPGGGASPIGKPHV